MSFPRNAATPKPIAIGRITLIADGSAVTSGASVRVQLDAAGCHLIELSGECLYFVTGGNINPVVEVSLANPGGTGLKYA